MACNACPRESGERPGIVMARAFALAPTRRSCRAPIQRCHGPQRLSSRKRGAGHPGETHSADNSIVKIAPIGISLLDEFHLPPALPFLQPGFAMDCECDIAELLKVDEAFHRVFLGESRKQALAVFPDSTKEIIGYADVQRPFLSLARM
jgi:hypothetical protein